MCCHPAQEAIGLEGDVTRPASTLLDGYEYAVARSDVYRLWPDQAIVGELLQYVGCPASGTANGKGRGEQRRRDVDRMQNQCGVKLDVGIKVTARLNLVQDFYRDPFDLRGKVEQFPVTRLLRHDLSGIAQDLRPWIANFIDAVSEAHDALAPT